MHNTLKCKKAIQYFFQILKEDPSAKKTHTITVMQNTYALCKNPEVRRGLKDELQQFIKTRKEIQLMQFKKAIFKIKRAHSNTWGWDWSRIKVLTFQANFLLFPLNKEDIKEEIQYLKDMEKVLEEIDALSKKWTK